MPLHWVIVSLGRVGTSKAQENFETDSLSCNRALGGSSARSTGRCQHRIANRASNCRVNPTGFTVTCNFK